MNSEIKEKIFSRVCLISTLIGVLMLIILLVYIFIQGYSSLNFNFLNNFPSRFPENSGIKSALFGTLWLMILTAIFSIPLGIGAAIYLEEYAPKNKVTEIIEINISNLSGVPSIVYGILGLVLFVRALHLDRSILSGALTMSLLVLPTIITATREALRAVPNSIREASYALGANKLETIRHHLLPIALPWIITGNILALSRAIGETAPLIMIGALTFVAFIPETPFDPFTTLPIQIFNWTSKPQKEFQVLAASAIIVLLLILLLMNSLAIFIRDRYQSKLTNL